MGKEDTIGSRIREARKLRKLTQEALAERLHFNTSTISYYENNEVDISFSTLNLLAKELEVSAGYFFGEVSLENALDLQGLHSLSEDIKTMNAIFSSIERPEVRRAAILNVKNMVNL